MTLAQSSRPESSPKRRAPRKYLREPKPLFFPVEEQVPESSPHRRGSGLLADSVERHFDGNALVSCDQFVYWDQNVPTLRLAPDVAVLRNAASDPLLSSWRTWERGIPEVGVEFVSNSDRPDLTFDEKLGRYRAVGVAEVVRFDRDDASTPIRIWDLIERDLGGRELVERDLSRPDARLSRALGLYWCVQNHPEIGPTLRLSRDAAGTHLVLSRAEAERARAETERARAETERARAETERARAETERARAEAEHARAEAERSEKEAALEWIAALEAELARRR